MPATSSTEGNSSFAYAPGDLIASKYRLEQLLGEGGMGAVFRARNTSLDMQVALKLLRADMNRGLLAGRLLQEARAAAKLAHPAIVRVFDVGQTALGDPFIVMELLEGETLAMMIDRERGLAPIHAVQLLLPLADALSAAHAKGLVHRDFKPDNVMLVASDEGTVQPKLLDFGIVKSAHPDENQLSDGDSVVGSPDYMSPEQARGLEQIDARSDLWSFSVVLYEVMAGVPPFQASDYTSLLRMIVQDEPQTLKDRGVADHALSYIVSRGLSKDPMARYASVSQMGMALAAWLLDQGITEDACGVSVEKKWLARSTDPDIARKSWPPQRFEKTSGIRKVDIGFNDARSLSTLPPSSLAPTVESSVSAQRGPSRARYAFGLVALALLTLPLVWFIFGDRRVSPQPMTATPPASTTARVIEMSPPALPSASAMPSPEMAESIQTPSVAVPAPAPSVSAATSGAHRAAPQKFRPAANASKQERLSEKLLSPLTF
ncbi:MAG TPA: protein kinase [Polyangiaceae bacterium]|nr:protein kinase [Polyangiaceae bacterium]